MKRTILILAVALSAMLLSGAVSHGSAQFETKLTAKIPFSFTVCRETFAAGTYTIKHPPGSGSTLVIQSEDNRMVDIACVNNIQSPKAVSEGRLIFNRYGDQYFLAEAWWPGETMGHALVKTEKEQTLIKEFSGEKGAKKSEKVIIKFAKPKK
jgi:hypothetical protein